MSKPHKHAELIKAWADGAIIQEKYSFNDWRVFDGWWQQDEAYDYRIKPEPRPDQVVYPHAAQYHGENGYGRSVLIKDQLKLTFDGETGKLKSAEVL
jgi:hypothetical protein